MPRIERALLEQPEESAARIATALAHTTTDRARLVHALGRLCVAGAAPWTTLHDALGLDDPAAVKAAVTALAQSTSDDTESALLALWDRLGDRTPLRPLLRALGRVGGAASVQRLSTLDDDDPRAGDELSRARLMLDRRAHREDVSEIDGAARPPHPLAVNVECQSNLAHICAMEFTDAFIPKVLAPDRVQVTLRDALDELARCRVMKRFSFPLTARTGEDAVQSTVEALCGAEAQGILRAFTRGTVRYRVEWAGRRSAGRTDLWQIAGEVQRRVPAMVNDSRDPTWEVAVDRAVGGRIWLTPTRWRDPRFTWRVADVPAASHPTVAAALASVAGVRPNDVVWDPFVGSAQELLERARRGPYARMVGNDTDAAALEAARRNLDAAGVDRVTLVQRDAGIDPPTGVSLILTNPPFGYRTSFGLDLDPFLARFLATAHRALRPGGRMVWLSPLPRETAEAARALGMSARLVTAVWFGGHDVGLQEITRPGG
ncbi:MAG: methyltransferase [Polyangiales bacterium]